MKKTKIDPNNISINGKGTVTVTFGNGFKIENIHVTELPEVLTFLLKKEV